MGPPSASTARRAGLTRTPARRPAARPAGFDTLRGVETGAPAPFEVRCDRCRVTFPVGTRRCIHCGGPTGRSTRPPSLRGGPIVEAEAEAAEPDPERVPGRRFVSPFTLVWIALIAAGYLVRACTGQGP